jgi:uncharacterized protein (PEP-CTERM system associated)
VAKSDEGRGTAAAPPQRRAWRAAGRHVAYSLVLTLAASVPRAGAQEEAPAAPPASPGTDTAPAEAAGAAVEAPVGGQPAGNPAQQGREWTIVPAITGQEQFTDNVRFAAKGRQSDLVSNLTPSLYLNGDTPRLAATLSYRPTVVRHITATDQDEVLQNLIGNGTLTAVPELLFFDAHAAVTNENRAGGFGFGNQAQIPSSLSTQTTAYSGSPYVRFHFGDTGDEEVRYQFAQTVFSGNTGPVAGPLTGTTLGSISNSTQQEILAKFVTGEGFGRLKLTATGDYVDFSSASALSSRHSLADVNTEYNISGPFYALAEVGYERIVFDQQSTLDFNGPRWTLGGRFQPRADRQISLTYGKTEGQFGFNGRVDYAVTPLTFVTASYSHQTSTQQQQILQALNGFTQTAPGGAVNPATGNTVPVQNPNQSVGGVAIDPLTGLPTAIQNPNLALQNSTLRVRTLQASIRMQGGERNLYSLTVNRTEDDAVTAGSFSQTTTGGFATWNRDMSPSTIGILSAGYAQTTTSAVGAGGATGRTTTLTLTGGLTYALGETVTAAATYSMTRQNGGPLGSVLVDIAMLTLSKRF